MKPNSIDRLRGMIADIKRIKKLPYNIDWHRCLIKNIREFSTITQPVFKVITFRKLEYIKMKFLINTLTFVVIYKKKKKSGSSFIDVVFVNSLDVIMKNLLKDTINISDN